jgi:hypothetical protein
LVEEEERRYEQWEHYRDMCRWERWWW